MRRLRNAALELADRGWHVLPLQPRDKPPLGRLVPKGKDNATNDLGRVLGWWTREPFANLGVSCAASGLAVIDVDPRNGGHDSFYELERELGPLPETTSAESGGGGHHFYFQLPAGELVGTLGIGVDLKTHGYVLAEPSVHPSGRPYAWDSHPSDVPVAELPESWLARCRLATTLSRRADLSRAAGHADPLRNVPASIYVPKLTGREITRDGWLCCPFHNGGGEKGPSLQCTDVVWACFGCQPQPGKRAFGGNLYDLAALLWGYALPLRGIDFMEAQARLYRELGVSR